MSDDHVGCVSFQLTLHELGEILQTESNSDYSLTIPPTKWLSFRYSLVSGPFRDRHTLVKACFKTSQWQIVRFLGVSGCCPRQEKVVLASQALSTFVNYTLAPEDCRLSGVLAFKEQMEDLWCCAKVMPVVTFCEEWMDDNVIRVKLRVTKACYVLQWKNQAN